MLFSILFPNGKSESIPYNIKEEFDTLGITTILSPNAHKYFTCDPDTIKYRLDLFNDIVNIEPLHNVFLLFNEKLKEYTYYRSMKVVTDNASLFRQLTDIKFYTEFIDVMYENTSPLSRSIKSDGLKKLLSYIKEEAESTDFKQLKESFKKVDVNLQNIKSVTVGVNLDVNLNPKEAGLLKINSELFKSSNPIDKFLRMDFKESEYDCISPVTLLASGGNIEQRVNLNTAVINSLATVMKDALNKSSNFIKSFLNDKLQLFINIIDEFHFISRAADFIIQIKNKGLPLCKPAVTSSDRYYINGLYSTALMNTLDVGSIVPNDVVFDDKGQIFVLTGPNSGGKTVFLRSVGVAQALFQCGLLIPAKNAVMSVMDKICTHFTVTNMSAAHSIGRLEEECERIAAMMEYITPDTLILMDEAFSSTSAKDGFELANSYLEKLSEKKCKCIFSTHIHELADVETSKWDLLAAEITNGKRTYKIKRGYSDGTSDAKTIAKKYGLL